MALYAIDQGEPISARDADPKGTYRCIECSALVRPRKKGRRSVPHFYHLATAPSCRLYSKSEAHLLLQLELHKELPPGEAQMEKPLLIVNRVADLIWEPKKVAFEIQCSQISLSEAEARIRDYHTAGYDIVWILDDHLFNQRQLRPAEEFLRTRPTYFAAVRRHTRSYFYDQFEVFRLGRRVKRGKEIPINPSQIRPLRSQPCPPGVPQQIEKRFPHTLWYFSKDLIHRALLSRQHPSFRHSLLRWRALEVHLQKPLPKTSRLKSFLRKMVLRPYEELLDLLLRKVGN